MISDGCRRGQGAGLARLESGLDGENSLIDSSIDREPHREVPIVHCGGGPCECKVTSSGQKRQWRCWCGRWFVILVLQGQTTRGIPHEEDRDETIARPTTSRPAGSGRPANPAAAKEKPKSGRESIESFVVVFVAFLVWSLEAEGFVIPTGSMATTLDGQAQGDRLPAMRLCLHRQRRSRGRFVGNRTEHRRRAFESGTCVNCRFESTVDQEPSFSGDRVYVMKLGASVPFLGGAAAQSIKRWDVTVFKLPEEPEVRYIKRVVGMPNEVMRIEGGDLWVRPVDSLDFPQRLRRTLDHQQAMQMIVYDDDHRAAALRGDPRWLRWRPASASGWVEGQPGRFATGKASRRLDRAALSPSRSQPGRLEGDPGRPAVARAAPGHADHRFQLVQHRRSARRSQSSARRPGGHGFNRTGWAT